MNDSDRLQFHALRDREDEGALSPDEAAQLSRLIARMDEQETARLAPAHARMSEDIQRAQSKTRQLRVLVQREEALAARLQTVLQETRAERLAITQEAARVLAEA